MKKFFLFSLFLLLCFLRLQFAPKLNLKEGQMVRVSGKLIDEPQIFNNRQSFKIGQFNIITQRWPEYHYGEEVEIIGKLKVQSSLLRPVEDGTAEGQANIKKRLLNCSLVKLLEKEKYLLSYPEIKIAGEQLFNAEIQAFDKVELRSTARFNLVDNFKMAAIWARLRMRNIFNKSFSKPFDGIVSGIVIGDKSLIDSGFYEKLKQTGTLHIMVASGSNIAMFAEGLLSFLCLLFVRKIALLLLISLIWFYVLITGLQPPIIRAGIMASLLYLGDFSGRKKEGGKILWSTGIIMTVINPELIYDVGFQLSFLATAGLVYIQPILKRQHLLRINSNKQIPKTKWFDRLTIPSRVEGQIQNQNDKNSKQNLDRSKCFGNLVFGNLKLFGIWCLGFGYLIVKTDNFSSSMAAFLATTPILLLNFGQFNLLSPLINLAILLVVPFILQIGMGLGILGLLGGLGMKIAEIFSFLLYPLLFYLEKIINLSAKWTFFQLQEVKIGWWLAAGYYLLLWVWVRKKFEI